MRPVREVGKSRTRRRVALTLGGVYLDLSRRGCEAAGYLGSNDFGHLLMEPSRKRVAWADESHRQWPRPQGPLLGRALPAKAFQLLGEF